MQKYIHSFIFIFFQAKKTAYIHTYLLRKVYIHTYIGSLYIHIYIHTYIHTSVSTMLGGGYGASGAGIQAGTQLRIRCRRARCGPLNDS